MVSSLKEKMQGTSKLISAVADWTWTQGIEHVHFPPISAAETCYMGTR